MMVDQLELPNLVTYILKVAIGSIPKLVSLVLSLIIAAYQVELFFAPGFGNAGEDQPVEVCNYYNDDDNYYGYRICINMMSAAMVNIFLSVTLLIIDLFIPCLNSGYLQLSQLFTMVWSIIMAVYMLITSALITNLYTRYCDTPMAEYNSNYYYDPVTCKEKGYDKFSIIPVFGFIVMADWIIMATIAFIRMIFGKQDHVRVNSESLQSIAE